MKAIIITIATGQRALVADDKALRVHADPYSEQQKEEWWRPITKSQRAKLLAEAIRQVEVDYDESQSQQYGRPIWH